jgi:hypothetical protein
MFSATTYVIRPAIESDAAALRRLADLDSQRPLSGPVLLGELNGSPAAAIALTDNRVIADPFRKTGELAAHLRIRAMGLEAALRTPRLRDRIRAAIRIDARGAAVGATA